MTDTDPASAVPSSAGSPKEDAATKSAREELKHTAISEKTDDKSTDNKDKGEDSNSRRAVTPDKHDALKEQVSSPKKKRAHDELDHDDDDESTEGKKKKEDAASSKDDDAETKKTATSGTAALDAPNGGASRADEPEKKRLRDEEASNDTSKDDRPAATAADAPSAFASSGFAKLTSTASPFGNLAGGASGKPSLFGSSSGSASPFGALGGASAAPASTTTSDSTTKPAAPSLASPPTLSFGNSGSASPFASVPSSTGGSTFGSAFGGAAAAGSGTTSSFGGGFGSGLGSGFGGSASAAGGARSAFGAALSGAGGGLTSFAKPGAAFKSDKPARPFGAPESDDAEESDDEDSAAEEDENGDEDKEDAGDGEGGDGAEDQPAKSIGVDADKKKQKLQRVAVDDGEAGEATLLQVRARMYYLDKDLGGWKERGAGMLKINVPEHCVEFDRDGSVIPASFDASTLGEEEPSAEADEEAAAGSGAEDSNDKPRTGAAAHPRRTVVRLIMRQDSTHRVILNTAVLPSTEFKERQTLKATTVLFTAFEGAEAKPVSMQAKMSIPNAKALIAALEGIQKELRGD
ncbi:hypothetical protein Sste5346_007154 [Sporothrix stenoceras]|uniref:RanBD1 domain-containing protein n=1 Tax=Sporothrix stenoceras TaxID=5173 RepID=A0ABR3YWS5_9PEZI